MDISLVAATGCLSGLVLVFEGARRERAVACAWDTSPTSKSLRTYNALASRLRDRVHLVDVTLERALELSRAGMLGEARRALSVAHKLMRLCAADTLGMNAGMAEFSRSAAALSASGGLPARRLRTRSLAWRAHLCNLVQPFLVTAGERFRLRLLTLRESMLQLNRVVEREERRLQLAHGDEPGADWAALDAARTDLGTLTGATLDSLRQLLDALGAQRRPSARMLAEQPRL